MATKTIEVATGIVSEIRVATLTGSDNEYLKYPCQVCVHVIERGIYGDISQVTVNTGDGAFVTAKRARFIEMSPILPFQYQQCNPKGVIEYWNAITKQTTL